MKDYSHSRKSGSGNFFQSRSRSHRSSLQIYNKVVFFAAGVEKFCGRVVQCAPIAYDSSTHCFPSWLCAGPNTNAQLYKYTNTNMNKLHIVSHRGCMWGQTGGGDLRPLFISLHFTPRSSFSYNHCTLPPMCPHNPPKNWFTQNFTRIEIGLGQFLSFRWKKV